jgi:hypothetical protein
LTQYCYRGLTAVRITAPYSGGPREIVFGSAYLPFEDAEPPSTPGVEKLVMGYWDEGTHLIIGCHALSHHSCWGSTYTNNRGESLFNYFMANGLDITNRGNRPNFVTLTRQEVIDITIATIYAGNSFKVWNVTGEVSCSDHRYIQFNITGIDRSPEVYRIPRRTDWESFRTHLPGYLGSMTDKITDYMGLETAATQLQDAIVSAYNDSCPVTATGSPGRYHCGTETLQNRGGDFESYLMLRRSQGTGLIINDP